MSAFMVSFNHITALLHYAAAKQMQFHWDNSCYDPRDIVDAQALGEILLQQNVRSMLARYTQDKPEEYEYIKAYKYAPALYKPTISAIQAVKACHCFDYQACETEDWENTFAYRICHWIESKAITELPGYDAAQWEIK